MTDQLSRIAAFCDGEHGGNPAGVWIGSALPDAIEMQHIAAEVDFSETAFAAPLNGGWRVRYFSPQTEVPFCGHATIALGAALALRNGDGQFDLTLNQAKITVSGQKGETTIAAALQSPPTQSLPAPEMALHQALDLFGYSLQDLDPRIPPAMVFAGAKHLLLCLKSRAKLRGMRYDFACGKRWMNSHEVQTIALIHAESDQVFQARNPFAAGVVYEDPATGAAAAALAGYLRDIAWPHGGAIELIQGEDMGCRSLIHAEIGPEPGSSIRISGHARLMTT